MNSTARRWEGGLTWRGARQRRLVKGNRYWRRCEAGWGGVTQRPSGLAACSSLGVRWTRGLRVLCAIRSKWSLPTRLETRTKESNVHASVPVEKPTRAMKVSDAKRKQQHRPTMILW